MMIPPVICRGLWMISIGPLARLHHVWRVDVMQHSLAGVSAGLADGAHGHHHHHGVEDGLLAGPRPPHHAGVVRHRLVDVVVQLLLALPLGVPGGELQLRGELRQDDRLSGELHGTVACSRRPVSGGTAALQHCSLLTATSHHLRHHHRVHHHRGHVHTAHVHVHRLHVLHVQIHLLLLRLTVWNKSIRIEHGLSLRIASPAFCHFVIEEKSFKIDFTL